MSAAENAPPLATTARWRLSRGIPVTQALRVGEQLQRAVLSCAAGVYGEDAIPWVLSGHGVPAGLQHRHAFYLPEDADGDGWLDHVVVHAEAGLEPRALTALGLLTHVVFAEVEEMWAGDGRAMRGGGTLLGEARWWVAATPYLPPRYRKKRAAVEDQLWLECAWRGLPRPSRAEELFGASTAAGLVPAAAFERHRARAPGEPPPPRPPHPQGWFFAMEFNQPVAGPLALGYGCHFGLGLFRPVELP